MTTSGICLRSLPTGCSPVDSTKFCCRPLMFLFVSPAARHSWYAEVLLSWCRMQSLTSHKTVEPKPTTNSPQTSANKDAHSEQTCTHNSWGTVNIQHSTIQANTSCYPAFRWTACGRTMCWLPELQWPRCPCSYLWFQKVRLLNFVTSRVVSPPFVHSSSRFRRTSFRRPRVHDILHKFVRCGDIRAASPQN